MKSSFLFALILSLVLVLCQEGCNFHYDGYIPPPGSNETYYLPGQNGTGGDWGNCPDSMCDTGKSQSPIDLVSDIAKDDPELGYIDFVWRKTQNVTLIWTGNNQLYITNAINQTHPSWITHKDLLAEPYYLNQFHLHQPSEHSINGHHYDVEVHFVHQNKAKNSTAVVGFMFEVGDNTSWSEFFDLLLNEKPSAQDPADIFVLGTMYPGLILGDLQTRSYFHYLGSFTTPGCAEGVNWFVMQDPIQIHKSQLDRLDSYQTVNNRPIQPLNERTILSFVEGPDTFCSQVGENCSYCQSQCKSSCKSSCKGYNSSCTSKCQDQCQKKMCSEVC